MASYPVFGCVDRTAGQAAPASRDVPTATYRENGQTSRTTLVEPRLAKAFTYWFLLSSVGVLLQSCAVSSSVTPLTPPVVRPAMPRSPTPVLAKHPPSTRGAPPDAAPVAEQHDVPLEDFAERQAVPYDELIASLRSLADATAEHPVVRAAYDELRREYGLSETDLNLHSFSRVRLAFEATRDGGYWGLTWGVTNRMPRSDAIWQAWQNMDWSEPTNDVPRRVVAECDELSALFALIARDLEIQGFAGLFWPTWNHTVAVWQLEIPAKPKPRQVRIVVPTSQIWLSRSATLGTREFKANHVVFPYKRTDIHPETPLPVGLVRYLLQNARNHVQLDAAATMERRNQLGGS